MSVWEMPLYHRSETGKLMCQRFRGPNGTERAVVLGRAEKQVRESMIAAYASQVDVRDFVSAGVELFRPQAEYEYARPPHPGPVNYELWQWPISASPVCQAFEDCARAVEAVETICFSPCSIAEQTRATAAGSAGA